MSLPLFSGKLRWSLLLVLLQTVPGAAQECPSFDTWSVLRASSDSACPGERISVTASDIVSGYAAGCQVEFFAGTDPGFSPDASTRIGSLPVEPATYYDQPPRFKGHLRRGCSSKPGTGLTGGEENEYMVLWSHGGAFVDSFWIQLQPNFNDGCANCGDPGTASCAWLPADRVKRLRAGSCGNIRYLGPGDTIPPLALVVILPSSIFDLDLDVGPLCWQNDPVYVMQAACSRLVGNEVQDAIADGQLRGDTDLMTLAAHSGSLSTRWTLAGGNPYPGYFERTQPEGEPSRDTMDCAREIAFAVNIRDWDRELRGSPQREDYTLDYTIPDDWCGKRYFKSRIACPAGDCSPVINSPSVDSLWIDCPTVSLTGRAAGCVGEQADGLMYTITDLDLPLAVQLRIGTGSWSDIVLERASGTLPYTYRETDAGEDQSIDLRLAEGLNGCTAKITSSARATVGVCQSNCSLPSPGRFSVSDTLICHGGDRPLGFSSPNLTEGLVRSFVVYRDSDLTDSLTAFPDRVPAPEDLIGMSIDHEVLYVVARTRPDPALPGSDPACTSDSPPLRITLGSEQVRASEITLCAGETFTFPDGTVLSETQPTVTLRRAPSGPGCDTVENVTATFLPRPSIVEIVETCTGIDYALPNGTVLNLDNQSGSYIRPGPAGSCDTLVNVSLYFVVERRRQDTVTLCPDGRFTLPDGSALSADRRTATYLSEGENGACDTTVTVYANVVELREELRSDTICEAGRISVGGELFTANRPTGVVIVPRQSGGCDSVRVVVDLTVGSSMRRLFSVDTLVAEAGRPLPAPPVVSRAGGTFLWTGTGLSCEDCANPTLNLTEPGYIALTYTSPADCVFTDSFYVEVVAARPAVRERYGLAVPTAFSPNGDGQNDAVQLYSGDAPEIVLYCRVYGRYGNLLHERTHVEFEPGMALWDGLSIGKPLDPGTFVVVVAARWPDGTERVVSNSVTLLR